jgi:hypothetical protein
MASSTQTAASKPCWPLSNKMPSKPIGHNATVAQMDASGTKQFSKQTMTISQIDVSMTT